MPKSVKFMFIALLIFGILFPIYIIKTYTFDPDAVFNPTIRHKDFDKEIKYVIYNKEKVLLNEITEFEWSYLCMQNPGELASQLQFTHLDKEYPQHLAESAYKLLFFNADKELVEFVAPSKIDVVKQKLNGVGNCLKADEAYVSLGEVIVKGLFKDKEDMYYFIHP